MDKNEINKKILSFIVAGGIAVTPISVGAEEAHRPGVFYQLNDEKSDNSFNYYVVKKGDNLSKICRKICRYFNRESSTDCWPALAFLNNYPRIINERDIIKFPKDYDSLVALNDNLLEIGWTRRYIYENDVYGKRKRHRVSIESVGDLLHDIYGDDVCIDEDFIRLYMEATNLSEIYELTGNTNINDDLLSDFTIYIPSISELEEYRVNNKQKTMIKK